MVLRLGSIDHYYGRGELPGLPERNIRTPADGRDARAVGEVRDQDHHGDGVKAGSSDEAVSNMEGEQGQRRRCAGSHRGCRHHRDGSQREEIRITWRRDVLAERDLGLRGV